MISKLNQQKSFFHFSTFLHLRSHFWGEGNWERRIAGNSRSAWATQYQPPRLHSKGHYLRDGRERKVEREGGEAGGRRKEGGTSTNNLRLLSLQAEGLKLKLQGVTPPKASVPRSLRAGTRVKTMIAEHRKHHLSKDLAPCLTPKMEVSVVLAARCMDLW